MILKSLKKVIPLQCCNKAGIETKQEISYRKILKSRGIGKFEENNQIMQATTVKYDPSMLNELLRTYYGRLFPYESYMQWIGGGQVDKQFLSKREFSFTLEDDIYLRYLSFSSAQDLKNEMVKRIPHKIDIGAIFNAKPTDHKKIANFQPQEKELVFDIDMTDYDDVRTCCEGAAICSTCWQFMTVAVEILNR